MPSTVEQLSPTRVKITVEVPFADLKPSMDKAYAEVAKSVNIPGFRRGKVPPVVIDQRFGRGVIIQEAFNDSWQRFYGAAVTENNLSPLAQPDVEVTKLEDGDLIEFTAEVDVRPEFELPDFSTLQAQVDALDVPDTLVEQPARRDCATVSGPAKRWSAPRLTVTSSRSTWSPARDGEQLADATAEDVEYTIGSGQMLDGLDEAVIGLSAGESATFSSTLVSGPLAGRGSRHRGHREQGARSSSCLTPTMSSPRRRRNSTRSRSFAPTSRTGSPEWPDSSRPVRPAMPCLESLVGQVDIEVPEHLLNSEIELAASRSPNNSPRQG